MVGHPEPGWHPARCGAAIGICSFRGHLINRIPRRFRELVKQEIAQTVDEPTQVQEELRYLLELLCLG